MKDEKANLKKALQLKKMHILAHRDVRMEVGPNGTQLEKPVLQTGTFFKRLVRTHVT